MAAAVQPLSVSDKAQAEVIDFVVRRLEQLMIDSGVPAEAVRAVIAERGDNPALASQSAGDLKAELAKGDASQLNGVMMALSRPTRIVRGKAVDPSWTVSDSKFELAEEKALYEAYKQVSAHMTPDTSIPDFLAACQQLLQPIDGFFEKVFVMCDDEAVRNNRLALLRDIAGLTRGIVDLSQLPGF